MAKSISQLDKERTAAYNEFQCADRNDPKRGALEKKYVAANNALADAQVAAAGH